MATPQTHLDSNILNVALSNPQAVISTNVWKATNPIFIQGRLPPTAISIAAKTHLLFPVSLDWTLVSFTIDLNATLAATGNFKLGLVSYPPSSTPPIADSGTSCPGRYISTSNNARAELEDALNLAKAPGHQTANVIPQFDSAIAKAATPFSGIGNGINIVERGYASWPLSPNLDGAVPPVLDNINNTYGLGSFRQILTFLRDVPGATSDFSDSAAYALEGDNTLALALITIAASTQAGPVMYSATFLENDVSGNRAQPNIACSS